MHKLIKKVKEIKEQKEGKQHQMILLSNRMLEFLEIKEEDLEEIRSLGIPIECGEYNLTVEAFRLDGQWVDVLVINEVGEKPSSWLTRFDEIHRTNLPPAGVVNKVLKFLEENK